jgi:chromate transporter
MQATTTTRPQAVTLGRAFWYWLKLGFISFGGPAGQIALMHTDLVERRRWISEQRFLHALNYCMLLPGPEATQLAVYIGWLMHRTRGGIIAGTLFVLPSLLILIGLTWIYIVLGNVPLVVNVLYGIKPAVVAIVLAAAWRIGSKTLRNAWLTAIAIGAFVGIAIAEVPFPAIVATAAVLGAAGGRFMPGKFNIAASHGGAGGISFGPALIDDDTPTPSHARFTWRKLIATSLIGIGLGGSALLIVAALFGAANPLTQMGWFFTKAAMMTFGGAYAVLPYVYQGAVENFNWVTSAQMIDGLALGETTPGPLIMIVAFVGFIGGWTKQLFGADLFLAGMLGACVATFFTFLPSFVFILAGGPFVEATRDNIKLTAPLTAISAAVVGVIVSLAVFFAEHVFRLAKPFHEWDFFAMFITLAACVALFRFKTGTIKLIAACALAGLASAWFR